jgi:uncharacterized protein with FMN-binding domain
MKKTIIIICVVGALGLLHYGLRQNKQPTSLISPKQTSANQTTTQQPSSNSNATAIYKDGTYSGNSEDNPYGTVQIAVVISGGKISNVNFLQMPGGSGHTDEVTRVAAPLLKQTTLQKQSGNIDFVSGATTTSESYQLSLQSALDQAKI